MKRRLLATQEQLWQAQQFQRLQGSTGAALALFYCCAVFDVPYLRNEEPEDWIDYLNIVAERFGAAKVSFSRGEVTDVSLVVGAASDQDVVWELEWGYGPADSPYSADDYQQLDRIYNAFVSRANAAGGMDAQQEQSFRLAARLRVQMDKLVTRGSSDDLAALGKLNKIYQDTLAAENARKKDAAPSEEVRLDGIVDILRKKYGVGVEMTKDQALEIFSNWMVSHRYPFTKDAAEQMLLAIINTTRKNSDLPELDEIPEYGRFTENNIEFAQSPSAAELSAFQYLGIDPKTSAEGETTQ